MDIKDRYVRFDWAVRSKKKPVSALETGFSFCCALYLGQGCNSDKIPPTYN